MKRLTCLFCLFVLLGCDNNEREEVWICTMETLATSVLMVDYTTHDFLGGYSISAPGMTQPWEMACAYKSPGDFGSIEWYDKATNTRLFAGTIVWMGKGKRTFPEKIALPADFGKLLVHKEMPDMIPLSHDEYDVIGEDVDYAPVWQAISGLQCVSLLQPSTPVYIYLYRPSVGAGNPKDWYWVLFFRN